MNELTMEIRSHDPGERVVVGIVAPYNEVSYLTPDPAGERIMVGAFKRSIGRIGQKIPLLRNHSTDRKLGISQTFEDGPDGLIGTFKILEGRHGDDLIEDLRTGGLGSMSVGFQTVQATRGTDGVREIREARLIEVSMVAIPAYQGAAMLAVRSATTTHDLLTPFLNPVYSPQQTHNAASLMTRPTGQPLPDGGPGPGGKPS